MSYLALFEEELTPMLFIKNHNVYNIGVSEHVLRMLTDDRR